MDAVPGDTSTLLLVEDEAIIALEEISLLEYRGYRVLKASSGEEAVAVFDRHPEIALVLMDIDLGRGMDGTEAARLILQRRTLPLVFLSSHTDPKIVDKTEKITSYGYVVKQAGETVLIASIRMAFRLYEAHEKIRLQNEALRLGNRNMQLMLSNMITAFVVWESVFDEAGNFVSFKFDYFNEAYAEIAHFPLESVKGKDVFEVWPETERSWVDVYGQVATTGIPRTFEMFHGPTKGWYYCNAYRPGESNEKICVVFLKTTKDREGRRF